MIVYFTFLTWQTARGSHSYATCATGVKDFDDENSTLITWFIFFKALMLDRYPLNSVNFCVAKSLS